MSGNTGAIVTLFLGMFGTLALCMVVLIVYIRIYSKDRILCIFHKNKKRGGALLKYDSVNACVWVGREDDPNREKYDVTEDDIEWADWPGSLPGIFNVPIRCLDFVRNCPNAINLEKRANANRSAKFNRLQSDAAVLQAVYLNARQTLGIQPRQAASMIVIATLVGIALLSLFGAYKGMQTSSDMSTIQTQIENISNGLGIPTAPALTPMP